MFPNLNKVGQVAISLPITSVTLEHTFPAIRRIYCTYIRTTMNQDYFQNLALIHVEKGIPNEN